MFNPGGAFGFEHGDEADGREFGQGMTSDTRMASVDAEVTRLLDSLAPRITPGARQTLTRMYTSSNLEGTEVDSVQLGPARIGILQGSELHRFLKEIQAKRTLEVGFAYGFSTIWMIDAISNIEGSLHEAIDPYEVTHYKGVGLRQVQLTQSFSDKLKWECEFSIHALCSRIKQNECYDAIFIDGNHKFDNVLVDFFLSDKLVRVGGLIMFDDMWLPAIRSVVSFIENNRSYRRLKCQSDNMAVFEKIEDDSRPWDHYVSFDVSKSTSTLEKAITRQTASIARRLGFYSLASRLYYKFRR
jgi:predicted O-methyltransferase YrrM